MNVIDSDAWKVLKEDLKIKVLEQIAKKQLFSKLECVRVETDLDLGKIEASKSFLPTTSTSNSTKPAINFKF